MKKKSIFISSIALTLLLSLIVYKYYKINDNQQNINFRTDTEQDIQVKNNESMISKSLIDITNEQKTEKPSNYENSDTTGLSNNVGNNKLK